MKEIREEEDRIKEKEWQFKEHSKRFYKEYKIKSTINEPDLLACKFNKGDFVGKGEVVAAYVKNVVACSIIDIVSPVDGYVSYLQEKRCCDPNVIKEGDTIMVIEGVSMDDYIKYIEENADIYHNVEYVNDTYSKLKGDLHKRAVSQWKVQGLCHRCGGQMGGLFIKKCKSCGK